LDGLPEILGLLGLRRWTKWSPKISVRCSYRAREGNRYRGRAADTAREVKRRDEVGHQKDLERTVQRQGESGIYTKSEGGHMNMMYGLDQERRQRDKILRRINTREVEYVRWVLGEAILARCSVIKLTWSGRGAVHKA